MLNECAPTSEVQGGGGRFHGCGGLREVQADKHLWSLLFSCLDCGAGAASLPGHSTEHT